MSRRSQRDHQCTTLPASDGRAGPRRSEGGIKGEGGLDHLIGRLRALLAPGG